MALRTGLSGMGTFPQDQGFSFPIVWVTAVRSSAVASAKREMMILPQDLGFGRDWPDSGRVRPVPEPAYRIANYL